jgi:hypothetical protein
MMVDRWFTEEYLKMHRDARDRRLLMQGPAHHQGSRNLAGYKQAWVRELIYLLSRSVLSDF